MIERRDSKNSNSDILKIYFDGIYLRLNAEIYHITNLINHSGKKGEANEEILIKLLTKFLPKIYSIGSGIIIDRKGNYSKQIDIIIYDSFYQPEIFAQTSAYLFPVDLVYAVIEVKTTLNQQEVNRSLENIKSVKELDYLKRAFKLNNYDKDLKTTTNSPYGIIFAYKADTNNFNSFYSWFQEARSIKKELLFEGCYVMEQTFFVKNHDLSHKNKIRYGFYPIIDENIKPISPNEVKNEKGKLIIKADNAELVCDQGRGLLIFLKDFITLLSHKYIIKEYFINDYIEEIQKYDYSVDRDI